MKIRKLISTLLSVALVSTLVSAFTVAHAENKPTLTATAAWDTDFEMIAVTVSYSGMDDLAPNSGNALLKTLTGISAASCEVVCDNPDMSYVAGLPAGELAPPSTVAPVIGFAIQDNTKYLFDNSGDLATLYFAGDKDAVANFTIIDPKIEVKAYEKNKLISTTQYAGEQIACVGATYGAAAQPKFETVVKEKAAVSNPTEAKTVGVMATSPEGLVFTKLTANLFNGSVEAPVVVYEGVSIDAPTTFGLNIMQVPAGVTITVNSVVAE